MSLRSISKRDNASHQVKQIWQLSPGEGGGGGGTNPKSYRGRLCPEVPPPTLFKREWAKRANPPYMTHFPWNLFWNLFYCRFCVIMRGYSKDIVPHWSFRIASRYFKLGVNLYQWVFLLLSSIRQKIFTWKTLARVTTYKQNSPGLWKLPKRVIPTWKKLLIAGFATSANKQPQVSHKTVNNNCLFRRHLCKPAVISLFASINVYTIVT